MEEEADHHQDLEQGTAQAQEVDEEVDDDDDDEDGDDDDDEDDEEEEEDGDNEDVDEDDEENDNNDDDDDDDDDEGDNDGSDEDSGEDDNMSVISDGLDSSNIIATRPKRAAAAKVSDYTSEEAIRKAGVAPQDEEAAAADGEDADQTYMDADDDDDDAAGAEGGADATDPDSKPPPKKKQRLPSPSPEPLPKPPPPRPTVRIKMITTQGAGNPSANIPQATPISMDSEEIDPDLYIMEIPHIMLEHLRQQQHPWADWVDETQRDAQKAILAQQEKEAAEKEAERERKAQAAALKAANAANAAASAAAAAAAAGGGESEGGGGAPPSGGAPDDLPPELAALLARHQEPTVPIKRVVRNRYDVTDPFVDDSELKIDEPTPVVETREKGFYVCIGPVEGFQAAQAKKKTATRRRTAASAATGANANRIKGSAAAAGGSKAGAAAIASPSKAAAQQSQPAEPPGAGQKMQQAMVATTASNQKPAGAKGAIDMLLAMRAKQTGLTVNEHVASGVVKPGTAPPPPPLPAIGHADGAGTDADPDIVEIRPSEMNGQSSARERDDRRKSEGSRTQPIAVDSTDDEDEEASAAAAKKASSSSGAAAAAGANGTPASAAAANVNSSGVSTRRSRSPAKAAAGGDAADASAAGAGGLGLRRTLRRNASTTAGLNSPAPGGDKGGAAAAASTQVENGKAPSSRPTPDSSAPADISISISGAAPGDSSVLSTNGTPHAGSSTPRASTSAVAAAAANGNATSTTPSGTAAAANAPRKNRYPCNPVDPRLAAAFEELRDVVSKEPFEVRTKFPAYLKPPLLKTAKLALELGEYDENFFNWLPTIFPYNRYTMMKLTKREFYEQHHAYYQTLQDETLDALKAIIDKTFPTLKTEYEEALKQWEETEGATAANANASGTNTPAALNKGVMSGAPSSPLTPPNGASKEAGGGTAAPAAAAAATKAAPKKRWKWDDEQRAYLHTCITTENAMVELAGEKA
ncbi:hypothetical protein OC846_003443 [Tilletia horrida]|uniref:Ubinuclein middle domain-containing protein n=1 Tax=Tilletia horrida TaxID=155126 RepID=A0AAN6GUW2_9BASI|nr:hypothetical protein OC846_003443 [Tilletia horrida]